MNALNVWVFVLAAGATLRLTRLAAKDLIFEPLRLWVINRRPSEWRIKLVTCQPCGSVWVAALVVTPAAVLFGDTWWFLAPALALTLSEIVVLVAINLDR